MTSLVNDAEKLRKEAEEKLAEVNRLERLQQAFPDLKKRTGRWNKVAFYSKTVNEKVDEFDSRHNCGCCSDSPLEIWPYMNTPDGKVFSDPPCFTVGERDGYGDRPYDNWSNALREARISGNVIERISMLFNARDEEEEDENIDT